MKVLVTGGLGFIGGYTSLALLRRNHRVTIVDIVHESVFSKDELENAGANVIIGDIAEWEQFSLPKCDVVVHLAAPVGPGMVAQCPGRIIPAIFNTTQAALDYAWRSDNAFVINMSSSESWGGGKDLRTTAPSVIVNGYTARREYAVAKIMGEFMLAGACAEGSGRGMSIRPFNIAGARQNPAQGFVLPRFIEAALNGTRLPVYGDGALERAFIDVRDMAEAIVRFVENSGDLPGCGEVYTVANPVNRTSIFGLAKRVVRIVGSGEAVAGYDPEAEWGSHFREADGGTKLPSDHLYPPVLDWEPQYLLDEMIRYAVAQYSKV